MDELIIGQAELATAAKDVPSSGLNIQDVSKDLINNYSLNKITIDKSGSPTKENSPTKEFFKDSKDLIAFSLCGVKEIKTDKPEVYWFLNFIG